MRHVSRGVLAALMILAVTATMAFAATAPAKPAALQVEGKILTMGKGWVQVQVTKIVAGKGLRQGAKIRVSERSKVKITQNGKAVTLSALKPGETVEILVQVTRSGKTVSYSTTSITIMQ